MPSTIVLSISVSSPISTSSTSLLSSLPISLTILFIFWNIPDTGTILNDITMSCSSSVSLRICLVDFVKLSKFNFFISLSDETMDSAITSSPTIFTSLSSLVRFTVIKLCLLCLDVSTFVFFISLLISATKPESAFNSVFSSFACSCSSVYSITV